MYARQLAVICLIIAVLLSHLSYQTHPHTGPPARQCFVWPATVLATKGSHSPCYGRRPQCSLWRVAVMYGRPEAGSDMYGNVASNTPDPTKNRCAALTSPRSGRRPRSSRCRECGRPQCSPRGRECRRPRWQAGAPSACVTTNSAFCYNFPGGGVCMGDLYGGFVWETCMAALLYQSIYPYV